MGQALRRAVGRARVSDLQPPAQQLKNAERPRPRPPTVAMPAGRPDDSTSAQDRVSAVPDTENFSRMKNDSGVLEERDPGYDAMLGKMVGRITSKPGGKLEMGEAFIVEKYNRPLPKLRNTKAAAAGNAEEKDPVPSGTLNVVQLRQIILLHEGKSEDHQGPMAVEDIAKKFRVDVELVQKILQFMSLPPEEDSKKPQQ